jgi:hypothetical protein
MSRDRRLLKGFQIHLMAFLEVAAPAAASGRDGEDAMEKLTLVLGVGTPVEATALALGAAGTGALVLVAEIKAKAIPIR